MPTSRQPPRLLLLLAALAALYLLVAVWQTASEPKQWDLGVYRGAARVVADRGDPYEPSQLSAQIDQGSAHLSFVYPPHVASALGAARRAADAIGLPRAEPLAEGIRVDATFFGFLALKLAAAAVLLWIWSALPLASDAGITRAQRLAVLLLVAVAGFHETLLRDLYAGNISVFEQLALWLGFAALLAGAPVVAALSIAAAALVKGPLAVFLPLVLLPPGPGAGSATPPWGRRSLAAALGALCAVALPLLGAATTTLDARGWRTRLAALDERGSSNPSTLSLARDLLGEPLPGGPPSGWPLAVWMVLAAVVAAVSARQLVQRWRVRGRPCLRLEDVLLLTCAASLVLPRFKNYSFLMLVPAATWALLRLGGASRWGLLLLLTVALWEYQALLAATVLWLLLLRAPTEDGHGAPQRAPQSANVASRPVS
ncbi:MAG: DUF2029 domain-containing protein [Acidobacteria bacterium]|mgnify:FL=1|nr:MAG: DUF2029 domain-containing protein [Acidobacteriota bacterium]